ncbi:MAG TPA: alcohol dehydrogenase catalytic domain-containing protein [Actinomycetota bacterium]|nr:alcohol dehydrogenase catalytic domain-containing protein [Actinomycetota bacterium]
MSRQASGAVVDGIGAMVSIDDLVIDSPGPDEVLVRIVASGVCHSDLWAIEHGNWGAPFPMLLGHEGAGVVEEVGEGVRSPSVGDPVVLAWAVPCGTCGPCRRGVPRRCSHAWVQPPRVRRARDAAPLAGTLSLGTLASHTVVHAAQAIPMPPELPLRSGCLLGCGASTGVGAAIQTAKVWPGARVAVIGLGGIGLSALQGARIAGAGRLVAVDIAARKLAWAERFGATDVVDASVVDAVAAVRELTDGDGVDVAFEATGVPAVVSQAVAMLDHAGTAVAIGVPPIPAEITLAWNGTPDAAYPRKASLLITDGGDPIPSEDFPQMARWALEGELDLDGMVTRELGLDDLDEAFRAMLAGEVIRSVVVFPG